MGDSDSQEFVLEPNDIYTFDTPVDLNDIFFKNFTAGNNTQIIVQGVLI